MKILVTGAGGQLGSCLVERLQAMDVDFLATGRNELDLSDRAMVRAVVKEFTPNYIINAAAYTAVDKAEEDIENAYAINSDGASYLAEAGQDVGATLLHISTDYVFSGKQDSPYNESDTPSPLGVYGKSKLAGEEAILREITEHIIIRTAWVFAEYGNNFVKTMLRLGAERDELAVVADQFGGPTYAGDLADALLQIIQKLENVDEKTKTTLYGTYHYSGEPFVSWYDFAREILQETVVVNAITTDMYPTPAKRPQNSRLSCAKIGKVFGIMPSDWKRALQEKFLR